MEFSITTKYDLLFLQQVIDAWDDVNGECHIYDYSPVEHDICKVAERFNILQRDVCDILDWYSYCSQFYDYYSIFRPETIID